MRGRRLLPLYLLAAGGLLLWTLKRRSEVSEAIERAQPTPSPERVFVEPPPGVRRARDEEVTPAMREQARALLREPLGSLHGPFADPSGAFYMVAIETHSNAPKGASVFIEETA